MSSSQQLYFDHAATSFPKAKAVIDAVANYLAQDAGNPGRGGYALAMQASMVSVTARSAVAEFFGRANPERVIFAPSATHALNLAIRGGLDPSVDHVVTTTIEHNAAIRPVNRLEQEGLSVTRVQASGDGKIAPQALAKACAANTKMVVVTAGSNVLGAQTPLHHLREQLGPEVWLCVDAAQLAGCRPLDMDQLGIDLLAVPGHKSLGGPPGIGCLLCSDRVELRPLIEGGTGGNSEPPITPSLFPDGFEAGTANGAGIAGLQAAVELAAKRDLEADFKQKMQIWQTLVEQLEYIDGLEILSCRDAGVALPLVSFRTAQKSAAQIAFELGQQHDIAVRAGLHCAPDAHRTAGSSETGLVRASLGPKHQAADVDAFVTSLRCVLES